MRGIEVDKGLNTLDMACAERGAFLRRYMMRIKGNAVLRFTKEGKWFVTEWNGDSDGTGNDLSIYSYLM